MRLLLKRAAAKIMHRTTVSCFHKWTATVIEQKRQRHVMYRIVQKMKYKTVTYTFNVWVEMVNDSKRRKHLLKKTMARIKNRTIAGAMLTWYDFVAARKQIRVLAARVFGRMVKGKLSMGWYSWQTYLKGMKAEETQKKEKEQIMKRVATKMKHRTVAVALETWIDRVYASKRMRLLLTRAAARMKHIKIAGAMLTWYDFVTARKHIRILAARVFGRMVKGKLSTGWCSWQAYLKRLDAEEAEQERHQRIMKRVATKMQHRTVAVAVETWIDMVYVSKRRKQLLIKTTARIALLKKKSLTSAFLKWQTYWTQMKEERALAWKVLSRLANVKIASAFHSWWLEVKEKKRHG